MVLVKRLVWRGIDAELIMVEPGDPVPDDGLIYLLGGGEDCGQIAAVKALEEPGELTWPGCRWRAVADLCRVSLCGRWFTVGDDDEVFARLGLLDVETHRGDQRAVGEILTQWTKRQLMSLITGFENHGGFTELRIDATPLPRTAWWASATAPTVSTGRCRSQVVAAYPHRPISCRAIPVLADYLLERALGVRLDQSSRRRQCRAR